MGDALPSSGASQHDHNAGSEPTYDDQAAFHQQQQQQQYSSAQHHAYGPGGPQVDMIQAHGGVRGGGSAGPYNMAGMIGALPQHGGGVAGGFRQQQPQQQHTASYGSPRLGQLPPQMAAYGQGAAGHAFYMHQPHHPQMQPYHGYGTSAVTSSLVVPAAAAAPKHQQRAAGSTSPYYQGQMHMTAIPPHLAGGYGGYYPAAQVTGAAAGQFVGAVGQPGFVVGAGPIVGGGPQQQPPYFEGSAGRGGRPADPRANQQSQASDRTPPPGSAGRGVESGELTTVE